MGFGSMAGRKMTGKLRKEDENQEDLWPNIKFSSDVKHQWQKAGNENVNCGFTPYGLKFNGIDTLEAFVANPRPLKYPGYCEPGSGYYVDVVALLAKLKNSWNPGKFDPDNLIDPAQWKTIVKYVKDSIHSRVDLFYLLTYKPDIKVEKENPNKIKKDEDWDVDSLGLWSSAEDPYGQITLYHKEISETAARFHISFELMAAHVLLHELGHYFLHTENNSAIRKKDISGYKNREESSANLIALICFKELLAQNKISRDEFRKVMRFMMEQPAPYSLALVIALEGHLYEFHKWRLSKMSESKVYGVTKDIDSTIIVDGKPSYF